MAQKFFVIPVFESESAEQELNGFLGCHKVLSIERRLIDLGTHSAWTFAVEYADQSAGSGSKQLPSRGRIDYKTILPDDEFMVFSKLRDLRKQLAQSEAVPVYALFTNEQLAQMVQRRCHSKAELSQIDGVGEAKLEKYSEQLLLILETLEKLDAANEEPV
ncbi:HRDC domain-containing protein [Planctomycetaceae bacterium SH139]